MDQRLGSLGNQLVRTHIWLREQLAHLIDGTIDQLPQRLEDYCAGFCELLTAHHDHEEGSMFVLLAEARPELAPVIAELRADHALVTDVLRKLAEPGGRTRQELMTLAALLETHFLYEEKKLLAALDALS